MLQVVRVWPLITQPSARIASRATRATWAPSWLLPARTVSPIARAPSTTTCLSSECHVSWEKLAERTADLGDYNPHDSIHGTIEDCNECHKGHAEQVDICGECHPNGGQEMVG